MLNISQPMSDFDLWAKPAEEALKQWMQKLIEQFDFEWGTQHGAEAQKSQVQINEERATLLFLIDTLNKHLIEFGDRPVRKVREILDEFAQELVKPENPNIEKVLFRFRQFYSNYRLDEFTYIEKTLADFRSILWDFVDQIGEDLVAEQEEESEVQENLDQLKEAVQANSIDLLKDKSRQFIDAYMEYQTKKDSRRSQKMASIKKNLNVVKKQLSEANQNMRRDHLTNAYNRKSFDEKTQELTKLSRVSEQPVSLIMLDIDHFKKINDTYGHANGDFVLIELVKLLEKVFNREADFVARVGGEEFAILLPDHKLEHASKKANEALLKVRGEAFLVDDQELRFTISLGVAQWTPGESIDSWMKRADEALYQSKNNGRNQLTLAPANEMIGHVA